MSGGIPFGNYRLLKRIARGGMAEVFLARQGGLEGFDRLVAVKRILPHLVDSESFVRMFLDEARLAARLSHANIVHIYEFGKVEEHYFIAMEYVEGIHAGTLIKSRDRLPLALAARIGADACAGLHYAHELSDVDGRPLKIVHRDVSPPNLIVSFDGVVKLVDFGIAKAVSQVEHTKPGVVKGKFAYMSPEQTTGDPLDGRSDVFSLGLVLWELLAGRVALSRADPVAAMTQIRDGKLPAIESVRSDVPPALAAAIGAALAVKPDDRATAIELGLALEALIKTFPEPGTTLAMAAWLRERFPRPTTGAHRAIGGARGATEGARAETAPATRAHTVPPTAQATAATGHLDALMPGGDTRIDTGAVLAGARPLTSLGRADTIATANAPHATHTEAEISAPTTARAAEISAPTTARAAEISAPTAANRSADLTEAEISATALMTRVAHRDLGARSRRRAPRIVIIGALAVAGGGAGAWALARATNNVQRPQVVVTAAPGAAAPAPVIAPLADAGAIAKAAASPAPDAAPAKAVAVATAVDAAPEAATLTVVTMPPGASVTVGDHAPEASPFTLTALSPGPYKVSVTLDGYRAQQASLVLGTGEKRTLQLALTAKPPPAPAPKGKVTRVADRHKSRHDRPPPAEPGLLNVRTAPYSVVYLGNRKLGVTPFAGVKLPPGHYTLVFEHPGRHRQSRRVHIRSGQTTKLSFALTDGR